MELDYPCTTDVISNTSTEAILPDSDSLLEAVGSKTEAVILTAYPYFCWIATFVGNGVVFCAVYKNQALHTQHYFVLCSYSVCDLVTCVSFYPLVTMVLFHGSDVPEWFCKTTSCLGMTAFYAAVSLLGLLAYERYRFFCRPLSYEMFFTTRKLSFIVAAAWVLHLGYFVAVEFTIGRKVSIAVLGCRLKSNALIHMAIAVGLSLLIILFSLINVGKIWAKMRVQTVPQVVAQVRSIEASSGQQATPVEELGRPKANRSIAKAGAAFKMIILVSGLFWIVYVPGFIARSIVSKGATIEEVESQQNVAALRVLRYSTILNGTVSQALNPLLYLFTHPDLRKAVKKLLKGVTFQTGRCGTRGE